MPAGVIGGGVISYTSSEKQLQALKNRGRKYWNLNMHIPLTNKTYIGHPPYNVHEKCLKHTSICCSRTFMKRDDMSSQYSPMSEDSDDSRFCEIPINACSSQSDSLPTSPVSPYRCQRPFGCPSSASLAASSPSYSHNLVAPTSSQTRQRGSDSEGRFPSSPSDICHSADLRRAALLRSVQMRTQPAPNCPYESPFAPGHEAVPNMESEDVKSLSDEKDYQIEECPSSGASSSHFNEEKTCRSPNSSTGRVESGI
ncbi:uncharacterized protein LOC115732047 isoform X2 [Rhodamnia argentea]|uniref:Uncharacterized protein LOC115732047 isoform X2 n=1 Tax=Rhodamnia argentea TaxID=178133 RepID=A0ABM3HM73_9MYRT|nr:uncharacterized protein LOC115732047 isoform X2 [Rhodamnia argentea]